MIPWKSVPDDNPAKGFYSVYMDVDIRNNETGELRTYHTNTAIYPPDTEPLLYIWEDGNYSCDCNRSLFFQYANGVSPQDSVDYKCGDERFSIRLKHPEDGRIIYDEIKDEPHP